MILESPTYLWLLALAAAIVFLYFLQARHRRYEVSGLFLWEGFPSDRRTQAARLRARIDVLLLLQLVILASLAAALAHPAWLAQKPRLRSLAVVLDGSASLRARSADGLVGADRARDAALALLDRFPTTPVALLELSASPRVLASLSTDHGAARRALGMWEPTWYGNGTAEDLALLLSSQPTAFERVLFLTDGDPGFSLGEVELMTFPRGDNLALTAFSVRESPSGAGAVAFLRVLNDTDSFRETNVRVDDGRHPVQLTVVSSPREEQAYVVPLPGSAGPVFTATLDGQDALSADNERVYSLARRAELRIRVEGSLDRYLRTALQAIDGVRFVDATALPPADITVVSGAPVPDDVAGSALVVHGSLPGAFSVGADGSPGDAPLVVESLADPLLDGVDPLNFIIRSLPSVTLSTEGVTLVSMAANPVLWRGEASGRRIVLLAPDLLETNLPLTVDFPILVYNILRWLALSEPSAPAASAVAGEPVAFAPYGAPLRLRDPAGTETEIPAGSPGFVPKAPGIYLLTAAAGSYPVAVNLDPRESLCSSSADTSGSPIVAPSAGLSDVELRPLWPLLAALALVVVAVEAALYDRPRAAKGRP